MTSIKSILTRYFAALIGLLLAVFAFLYLPDFASFRTALADKVNLPVESLPIAFLVLLAGIYVMIAWRLKSLLSDSMVDLVKKAEGNMLNVSVGSKPKLMEASRMAFVIEAKASRVRELENLLDDAETGIEEFERTIREMEAAVGERENQTEELEKTIEDLKLQAVKAQKLNAHLEESLEEERKKKVGAEVEKRTDEIYSQMEKAVEASAMRSLWLPKVMQGLKSPSAVINNLATRLQNKWEDFSFSRIREDLFELHRQSETLMEALDKAMEGEPDPVELALLKKGFRSSQVSRE